VTTETKGGGTVAVFARLAREAAANLASRLALTAVLVVVMGGAYLFVAIGEANAFVATRNYDANLDRTGYSTYVIEAVPNATTELQAADCQRLEIVDGVRAATWMRGPVTAHLHGRGGPTLPVWGMGGDVIELIDAADPLRGPKWHAETLLIDVGSPVSALADDGRPSIQVEFNKEELALSARTVRLSALGPGLSGNAIWVDPSPGPVALCLLFVEPGHREAVVASTEIALPSTGGISKQWVLANADAFDTPTERFEHRSSQWNYALAAVAVWLVWCFTLRLKRSDRALYAVIGLRSSGVAFLAGIEFLGVWLIANLTTCVAFVSAAAGSDGASEATTLGVTSAARASVLSLAACLVTCWFASGRAATSTLDAIKDR
jgi:hypothetical protein